MKEPTAGSLMAAGMRSYPKAFAALNEFGRLVISAIRDIVAEELGTLAAAMRVGLPDDELGDYIRPNRLATANPKDATLGVRIDRIGKSGWGLYFYLWWSKDQPKLSVSIWLRDGAVAESVYMLFKELSSAISVELYAGHEVFITGAIAADNADEFPLVLRELIQRFSDLWSKAGGLEKFLKM